MFDFTKAKKKAELPKSAIETITDYGRYVYDKYQSLVNWRYKAQVENEVLKETIFKEAWHVYHGHGGTSKSYGELLKSLDDCIESNPNDAHLYWLRGGLHLKGKSLNKAHSDFMKAAELDPTNPIPYIELAKYIKFDDPAQGIRFFTKALEAFGDKEEYSFKLGSVGETHTKAQIYSQRADLYRKLGNFDAASEDLINAEPLYHPKRNPEEYKKYQKRIDENLQSIEIEKNKKIPKQSGASSSSSDYRFLDMNGLSEESEYISYFEKAWNLAYGNDRRSQPSAEEKQTILTNLDRFIDATNDSDALWLRARFKANNRNYAAADIDYEKAIKANPNNPKPYIQQIREGGLSFRDPQKALSLYEKALNAFGDKNSYKFQYGAAKYMMNKADVHYSRGQLREQLGMYKEALEDYHLSREWFDNDHFGEKQYQETIERCKKLMNQAQEKIQQVSQEQPQENIEKKPERSYDLIDKALGSATKYAAHVVGTNPANTNVMLGEDNAREIPGQTDYVQAAAALITGSSLLQTTAILAVGFLQASAPVIPVIAEALGTCPATGNATMYPG